MADPPIPAPGETLAAETLQAFGSELTSYTPVLTGASSNPVLGTGSSAAGMWMQAGPLAHVWFAILLGTSGVNAGSGQWRVSLPVDVAPGLLTNLSLGAGRAIDNSVATDLGSSILELEMAPGLPDRLIMATEEGVTVAASIPWTWATEDRLFGHACYPGDF